MSLLRVRELSVFYGNFQALFGVSLDVRARETVAVIGANGAGKTTLLRALAGALPVARDAVTFEGRAVGAVVLSEGAQAGGSTLAALRSIIHALRGWPTPLGVVLLAGAGEDADEMRLALVAEQVVRFARGQACGNA